MSRGTPVGMPGPGGSMGKCFVCGDSFIVGVLMDLSGYDSGIESFSMGCFDNEFFAHAPKCIDALKSSMKDGQVVPDSLPDGPLKTELLKLLEKHSEIEG